MFISAQRTELLGGRGLGQVNEAAKERRSWNQRYARGQHIEHKPNAFLLDAYRQFVALRFPTRGAALDVAGGAGRHALWLAEHGWDVTLVDISDVGVKMALRSARALGLKLRAEAADVRTYDFGWQRFDLVLVFYFLQRKILPRLAEAVKPRGLVIYKTYTREHQKFKTCSHPMYFLKPAELRHAFPGFEVLHYRKDAPERDIAELVVQKP